MKSEKDRRNQRIEIADPRTDANSKASTEDAKHEDLPAGTAHCTRSLAACALPGPAVLNMTVSYPLLVQGAVAVFLERYCINDPDILWGSFSTATNIYASSDPNGALQAALESIALAAVHKQEDLSNFDARKSAIHKYGKAIKLLGKALGDPQQRQSEETLLAIFFVCFSEVRINQSRT